MTQATADCDKRESGEAARHFARSMGQAEDRDQGTRLKSNANSAEGDIYVRLISRLQQLGQAQPRVMLHAILCVLQHITVGHINDDAPRRNRA